MAGSISAKEGKNKKKINKRRQVKRRAIEVLSWCLSCCQSYLGGEVYHCWTVAVCEVGQALDTCRHSVLCAYLAV